MTNGLTSNWHHLPDSPGSISKSSNLCISFFKLCQGGGQIHDGKRKMSERLDVPTFAPGMSTCTFDDLSVCLIMPER